MSSTSAPGDRRTGTRDDREIVPAIVEWLVGGLLAIGGLAMALGGSAVLWASDETLIAQAVADAVAAGDLPADTITPAQMTEIAASTAFWLGVGLVLSGLGMIVVAVLYVYSRYRSRQADGAAGSREGLLSDALLGAVATGLLSFVPASPILGGGVAGYVHGRRATGATKAGALSGLLAASPVVAILAFVAVGLFTGFANAGLGLGVVATLAIVIAIVVALVYAVGLGALGGYLADTIATDDADYDERTGPTDDESASR